MKSIIYYTHNNLDEPICSSVKDNISKSGLPIVSCSLKPIDFGKNVVIDGDPGVITMYRQILAALENSEDGVIFFCEHDVLYHESHFDFSPIDDKFYFNLNVWRWDYPKDRFITYDRLKSVSGMCGFRNSFLDYYQKKLRIINESGFENGRDPNWARKQGYEPKENCDFWRSEYPNIDIRHNKTITPPKVNISEFRRISTAIGWKECRFKDLKGWDYDTKLRSIYSYTRKK